MQLKFAYLGILGIGHHWFKKWLAPLPMSSDFLKQCWLSLITSQGNNEIAQWLNTLIVYRQTNPQTCVKIISITPAYGIRNIPIEIMMWQGNFNIIEIGQISRKFKYTSFFTSQCYSLVGTDSSRGLTPCRLQTISRNNVDKTIETPFIISLNIS